MTKEELRNALLKKENKFTTDYIEFTLLLHCKSETKKNAREFDFSGVFEFLGWVFGDYILIH